MTYQAPAIGEIRTTLYQHHNSPTWWVLVKQFKFDTIRQEAYWVTKGIKEFKTEGKAQAYANRMMDGQQ